MTAKNKNPLRYVFYVALAVLLYYALVPKPSGPKTGAEAPAFSLPLVGATASGAALTLGSLRGAPVVLEAFAGWCSTCRQAAPMLADASRRPRTGRVRFVGVSLDETADQANAIRKAWGIPYDVVHDTGSFAEAYRVKMLPTLIVLDAEGRVHKVATGTVSAARLEAWLSELGAATK